MRFTLRPKALHKTKQETKQGPFRLRKPVRPVRYAILNKLASFKYAMYKQLNLLCTSRYQHEKLNKRGLKKIWDYLGIFSNIGGGGLPTPKLIRKITFRSP